MFSCPKRNIIYIIISFLFLIIVSAVSSFFAYRYGVQRGWSVGYREGWYDQLLKMDDATKNMVCSRFWEFQNEQMLKDKETKESSYGISEIFQH